jgi:tetratricopeptide (TPR) repeat protein
MTVADDRGLPRRPPAAWLAAGLIVLAALAAYRGSFSGPLVYDDIASIAENPSIRHLSTAALMPPRGGLTVSGRPVLNLSFALNYALSGTGVWSYHVANFFIHVLAGLALFGVVRRTLELKGERRKAEGEGTETVSDATLLAFAIALLWTVHPLQTESVMYLAQRAESLMGLFYLLTLYCFIRSVESERDEGRRPYSPFAFRLPPFWAGLAVVACLLGMGTKEVMVSAPLIVFLHDRTFLAGTFREAWRRRRPLYVGLAATWLPLGLLVASTGGNRGGTTGLGVGVGWWSYALTQFQAVAHYLRLSLWPAPLVFDYEPGAAATAGQILPGALVVLLLAVATAWAVVRRPWAGFLGAWFFVILAPTSLVPSGVQAIAEHRMYLPLAAVIAALALGLRASAGRGPTLLLLGLAAVGLSGATARRGATYRSGVALWSDTVAQRPGNAFAENNLGQALFFEGRVAEAEAHYRRAVELDPGDAQAHYNLANILANDGRLAGAIAQYAQALRLRPEFFEAHNNLGLAFEKAGRTEEAITEFEATLRLQPGSFEAHCNLADVLAQAGRMAEGIAQYERALQIEPASTAAQENLGQALAQAGQWPQAVSHLQEAVRLEPGDADLRSNLALALGRLGRGAEASAQLEAAARLRRGNGVDPGRSADRLPPP